MFATVAVFCVSPPEVVHSTRGLDLVGMLMACTGFSAVALGLSFAGTWRWGTLKTVGLLLAGVVLVVLFVWRQTHVEFPLLPMSLLTGPGRASSYLAMFLGSAVKFGTLLFVTYYLQAIQHYSPTRAGWAAAPADLLAMVAVAVGNARLLPRLGLRAVLCIGLILDAVGMATLTRIGEHSPYFTTLLPGLVLTGIGFGLVFGGALHGGISGVLCSDAGIASAVIKVMVQVGGALGTAFLSSVAAGVTARYSGGDPIPEAAVVAGYTYTFWVSAIMLAFCAVVVVLLPPDRKLRKAKAVSA